MRVAVPVWALNYGSGQTESDLGSIHPREDPVRRHLEILRIAGVGEPDLPDDDDIRAAALAHEDDETEDDDADEVELEEDLERPRMCGADLSGSYMQQKTSSLPPDPDSCADSRPLSWMRLKEWGKLKKGAKKDPFSRGRGSFGDPRGAAGPTTAVRHWKGRPKCRAPQSRRPPLPPCRS